MREAMGTGLQPGNHLGGRADARPGGNPGGQPGGRVGGVTHGALTFRVLGLIVTAMALMTLLSLIHI